MSNVYLKPIFFSVATLFAPQASTKISLAALKKHCEDLMNCLLHKKTINESLAVIAATGSLRFIVLRMRRSNFNFQVYDAKKEKAVKGDEINGKQRTEQLYSDTSPDEFYRGELK